MCVYVCMYARACGKAPPRCRGPFPHDQTGLSVLVCPVCLCSSHISHQHADSNKHSHAGKKKKKAGWGRGFNVIIFRHDLFAVALTCVCLSVSGNTGGQDSVRRKGACVYASEVCVCVCVTFMTSV